MTILKGKQANLYLYRSGFIPVACVKTVTITATMDLIPTTTVDSDAYEDYEGGFLDADIELEGAMTFDQTSSWQFSEFIAGQRVKQKIRFEWVDDLGNTLTYEMYVLAVTVSSTNSQNGFSVFNVSMKRCGPMTTSTTSGGGSGADEFDYDFDFDFNS